MQQVSNKKDLIKISRGQHHTNFHIVNPKVSGIYELASLARSSGQGSCTREVRQGKVGQGKETL